MRIQGYGMIDQSMIEVWASRTVGVTGSPDSALRPQDPYSVSPSFLTNFNDRPLMFEVLSIPKTQSENSGVIMGPVLLAPLLRVGVA
jgi:hypothetical protein